MDITAPELKEKIDRGDDFVLIDVREPYERDEFNIGGRLIPIGTFMSAIDELKTQREKEIVVYCRSGNRSAMAVYLLKAAGFQNPRNLIGGMLLWQDYFGK
jgi:rhodanese-related sulfurtransferase